jgi:hypothetical protein
MTTRIVELIGGLVSSICEAMPAPARMMSCTTWLMSPQIDPVPPPRRLAMSMYVRPCCDEPKQSPEPALKSQ